jgi:glycine/D-amino acid oxidase-like deaminating enzyme
MTVTAKPATGQASFWFSQMGGLPSPRRTLPTDTSVDVCIVGAGFTGLWTAYYLKKAQPGLRIVVLEREFAGFGASGRNGGWASALIAGSRERFAATHGDESVRAQQRAMIDSVDEIVRVASVEGISADVVKSGTIRIAWTGTQAARLEHGVATDKHWGEPDARLLTPAELDRRICLPDARLAAFTPHCARIHPARYVRGLALVCEGLGVEIYEGCRVVEIRPGQVSTGRATVKAQSIIRATEGYTRSLRGERRTWLPMNSSMIVTEPLGDHVWSHIGWQGAETLGDKAFAHMYAQCTADGRIAIGGRGIPYRFGSRTDHRGHTQTKTVRDLEKVLRQRFPAAAETRVAHAWSGVLAVPRDWCAGVGYDSSTGLGYAGGYVGQGVSTTNLAGRTLCDLVLARDSQLTSLPWVEHRSRAWEMEPFRWLGVRAMYMAYRSADRHEATTGRESRLAQLADKISGRP